MDCWKYRIFPPFNKLEVTGFANIVFGLLEAIFPYQFVWNPHSKALIFVQSIHLSQATPIELYCILIDFEETSFSCFLQIADVLGPPILTEMSVVFFLTILLFISLFVTLGRYFHGHYFFDRCVHLRTSCGTWYLHRGEANR